MSWHDPPVPPRVIFYGGSFNPVHMGHVFVACYLSHMGCFDSVLVAPVYSHPYGKDLAPYYDRYEMCRKAMSWIPKVMVSDIERYAFDNDKPNYTYQTISALKDMHPDWDLSFAIGSDNAADIDKWHGGKELLTLAKPFIIGRPGHPDENNIAILPEISSTQVRESLIGDKKLASAFLPYGVFGYIESRGLYRKQDK